jgi:integrase
MARGNNKLSALEVKKVLPPGLYGDGGGLYLQVSAFDTKAWVFRYMMAGRARKMGLGPVSVKPNDKLITLAEARSMATDARNLVSRGVDPIDERKGRKAAQAAEQAKRLTFGECAEGYIVAHASGWKSPKHADQWRMTLLGIDPKGKPAKNDYCKSIRALPVQLIETAHIEKILRPIWETKTETASRVRGRIEKVLDRAKALKLRQGENPAAWRGHLDQIFPPKSQVAPVENHPALPYADLPEFMVKLRAKEGVSARALEFTILTAARTGDTIGATRAEVDISERLWTVPAARVKGKKGARKRDHVIPLVPQALAVLDLVPEEGAYIFPGGKGESLSNMAMAELLKDMGYSGDVATVHGFRSTFKDWCSDETDYPNEMSELALSHAVSDKVERAYRRGTMRAKRRNMMADWAAYCCGDLRRLGDNVVTLRGATPQVAK